MLYVRGAVFSLSQTLYADVIFVSAPPQAGGLGTDRRGPGIGPAGDVRRTAPTGVASLAHRQPRPAGAAGRPASAQQPRFVRRAAHRWGAAGGVLARAVLGHRPDSARCAVGACLLAGER